MSNRETTKPSGALQDWWPLLLVIAFWLVAVGFYVAKFSGHLSDEQSHWGAFGDFIGGLVNPAIALFALYMLIRTVQLQREELRATRAELSASRDVSDQQRRVMQRQLFESQFFNVIPQFVNAIAKSRTTGAANSMVRRINDQPITRVSNFMNEARAHAALDRATFAPVIALLKFAASILHTNEGLLTADDIRNYGAILRGFISDFEAWLIFAAIEDDPPGAPLEFVVDKYRLCTGISPKLREGLWQAADRPGSFLDRLATTFELA